MQRRYRTSKLYIQKVIDGVSMFITSFDDLSDEELRNHYNLAIAREDYEYAEANSRNLKLCIRQNLSDE